jgi:hypothetical protein
MAEVKSNEQIPTKSLNKKSNPTLIFCIIMDIIGLVSYFIPGIGEGFDFLWAPISAFIFYRSFKGSVGKIGSIVNFVEEVLPFIDFVPTFTLGYLYNFYFKKE